MELDLESVEVTLFFRDGNTVTLGREIIGGDRVSLEMTGQIDKRLRMLIGIDEHISTIDKLTT